MDTSFFYRICIITSLLLCISAQAFATHIRGAELTYEFTSANSIHAVITIYTLATATPRDSVPIHWGDNSSNEFLPLSGTQIMGSGIQKNSYSGDHTFTAIPSAPGNFYIVSMTDPNRNSDILNISNSVNVPLYIEDTIWFQGQSADHSPVFTNPLSDFSVSIIGDTIFYNPNFSDADGDSVTFDLAVPRQGLGNEVPGYIYPPQVISMPGDTITIDRHTGFITWAVPRQTGFYDIAILTREYRNGVLMGTVLRDILITVTNVATGVSDAGDSHPFVKIYPNPTQDILHVESANNIGGLDIYSTDGMLVNRIEGVNNKRLDLGISALPQGHYTVVTKDKKGASLSSCFEIVR